MMSDEDLGRRADRGGHEFTAVGRVISLPLQAPSAESTGLEGVEVETTRLLSLMPSDIKADKDGRDRNAAEIVAALKVQALKNGGVDREDVSVFLAEMTRAVPLRVAFQRHHDALMRKYPLSTADFFLSSVVAAPAVFVSHAWSANPIATA